ncbi:hypothetical protein BKA93DRAFT_726838, partial [Sparassis latifolia]
KEARIGALQAEIQDLQHELGEGINAEEIVKRHIKLLHQYNEAKDAAQVTSLQLAEHRQTTIRQIHVEYDLADDD